MTNSNSVASGQQWLRGLTSREREVALLVGTGMSNKDIAQQLGLSDGTSNTTCRRFFEKLAREVVTTFSTA